jgi:uracil-DNA glycosylase
MPIKVEKGKKANTREYLEAALEQAKKLLPGWMFAVIHRAAFPASGGRAARNRRLSATEKAWIEKRSISSLSNAELKSMLHKLNVTLAANKRQKKDITAVSARSKSVAGEMRKRGLEVKGGVAEVSKDEKSLVWESGKLVGLDEIKKGFVNGEPEGGMHAHGLDRLNGKTLVDGDHLHLFVVPGTGEMILTCEDGSHAHAIAKEGNVTEVDGAHSHVVTMRDGFILETKLGGAHGHELMIETSGFGGLHKHILRLQDGTEIESLSPAEFVVQFVGFSTTGSLPIHSAREVANALNEVRELQHQLFSPADFPDIEQVVEDFAKGQGLPELPNTCWEVAELAKDGAYCALSDMEDPILMKNPEGLQLAAGDIVELDSSGQIIKHSDSSEPHDFEEASTLADYVSELEKATKHVAFQGPQNAPLVFVSASPSPLELARKEGIAGQDGELFQEKYLKPLGLTKKDVAIGFAIPVVCSDPDSSHIDLWRDALVKSLSIYDCAKVVALGRVAKEALGPLVSFSLPHPAALRRHGDRGEVERKLKSIRKVLDNKEPSTDSKSSSKSLPSKGEPGTTLADSISELSKGGSLRVSVTKSLPEKQIVYGVILDPYQVDLHNDWIPPAEIEATAHDFLTKSRVVGLRHKGKAEAEVVESWVEVYPTKEDRDLALQNLPHRANRREFGNDVLHSGAWVAGVKLTDELWELHKRGELDAFSIGGFSFKTQISRDAMPEVEFVELQPQA